MDRRRVVVLGSTGSIGRQALDVIAGHPDRFELVGLVAGSDAAALQEQASHFGAPEAALGADAGEVMAARPDADVVLNAIVGAAGLKASVAALESGKTLALANKESLVAGGAVCLDAAARGGGRIVPVDSEHAAIAQCLEGRDPSTVASIVLTASGGPFRTRADLSDVAPSDALAHPTWSMGPKITIDSATMMNKALEVIEAHFLFDYPYDCIDVMVHPQSIVHGAVCFVDGSMLLQAAPTDMRIPIQAALGAPERWPGPVPQLGVKDLARLEFEAVDPVRFPAVALGYEAGRRGGSCPAVLNAANEEAVGAFLDERLPFTGIARVVELVLAAHEPLPATTLDEVLHADAWARREAARLIDTSEVAGQQAARPSMGPSMGLTQ